MEIELDRAQNANHERSADPAKGERQWPFHVMKNHRTSILQILVSHVLCAFLTMAHAAGLSPREEPGSKAAHALEIIHAWRVENPAKDHSRRILHIIYWTPSDRKPAPEYRQRLTRTMTHIQAFYAREMKRLGFGPQTINLDFGDDQLLRIHLVRAPNRHANYKASDGEIIREECKLALRQDGIDIDRETILIFCNMSNWDPAKRIITQNSPYTAGGSQLKGCAWQVDSPILDPDLLGEKGFMVRDGQYGNISLGRYNSIFIGGVAHEMGHALGLPHNCERKDEHEIFGAALMGKGGHSYGEESRGEGKGAFLTLATGLRLTTHPLFSGTNQSREARGNTTITDIRIETGVPSATAMTVTGKVQLAPGAPPVYAVLAYCDPDGGGDYDATTATAIPDAGGTFTLCCDEIQLGKTASLRLIALYANGDATSHTGATSPYSFSYSVGKDGKPRLK